MWQLPSSTDLDLVFLAGDEEDRELAAAGDLDGGYHRLIQVV